MDDEHVLHAMGIDDTYHVERVLTNRPEGTTEIVTLDGSGPFIRKKIPSGQARRGVWATLAECSCARLPHVVAAYEMPDEFVVVYDFVPGESLEKRVAAQGRFAEEDACRAVLQTCEAVEALHAHGIIHRDISPANVIMSGDGAHLVDLGIARFRVEGATRDTTQMGTWGFASPEQCGFAQTDARSDVYSLGRLLGYLLTGVRPNEDQYESLLSDEKIVPSWLHAVIGRACAFEPSARYQSVRELREALTTKGAPQASEDAPAVAPTSADAVKREGRPSRTRLAGLVAVVALVVIAAVIALVVTNTRGESEPSASVGQGDNATEQLVDADEDVDGDAGENSVGDTDDLGVDASTPDVTGTPDATTGENPLEIVESGWQVTSTGSVLFAYALRNTGDATVQYPNVTVTGRDANGAVVFSYDSTTYGVAGGETFYTAGLADGDESVVTVEFVPEEPQEWNYSATSNLPVYEVVECHPASDGWSFLGEVRTVSEGEYNGVVSEVEVVVVLRDEDGNIIGGYGGFVSAPAEGETRSFEVMTGSQLEYASYEVYANPW